MFYDLDVNVPRGARSEVLDTLSRLGYNVIAFTTIVSGVKKLKEEHVQNIEASQHGSRKRVVRHLQHSDIAFILRTKETNFYCYYSPCSSPPRVMEMHLLLYSSA